MNFSEQYPAVTKAIILLATDSGIINRFESEDALVHSVYKNLLGTVGDHVIRQAELGLSRLSADDLYTACYADKLDGELYFGLSDFLDTVFLKML